jgi:hypothetical protein
MPRLPSHPPMQNSNELQSRPDRPFSRPLIRSQGARAQGTIGGPLRGVARVGVVGGWKANILRDHRRATVGTESASPVLWFSSIQSIEREQDLPCLAPKDCFIPAQPVEWVAGQIG